MFWTLKYWQPDTTSDSTGSPCRRLSQTPCPIASPARALLSRCWLAGAALITLGFLDPVFFSLPVLNIDNVKHTSRPSTASHWCCDERLAAVVGRLLGLRPLGPTAQTLFVRCLMLAACCMVDRCFCPLPWIFPMTPVTMSDAVGETAGSPSTISHLPGSVWNTLPSMSLGSRWGVERGGA